HGDGAVVVAPLSRRWIAGRSVDGRRVAALVRPGWVLGAADRGAHQHHGSAGALPAGPLRVVARAARTSGGAAAAVDGAPSAAPVRARADVLPADRRPGRCQ